MSDLTNTEKRSLERMLGMGSGYVLDFSNRTFDEFIMDSVGKSIYDSKYDYGSGSKANRLRGFWAVESNHIVGRLLEDLITYAAEVYSPPDAVLLENGGRIAHRLSQSAPVPEIGAIAPNTTERDFATLAKSVREAIEKDEPETGLDRLHTFVVRYMKVLCETHGIATDRDKPLHSMVGEYVKCLRQENRVESEMTERILKSTISTLEAFNRVRNDHSFAHDNPILNYEESLLIYNHVTSSIRFIDAIEREKAVTSSKEEESFIDDDLLPL